MGFANFVLLTRLHMFQTTGYELDTYLPLFVFLDVHLPTIALSLQSDLNRVNP